MKDILISTLRDKNTSLLEFREAANRLTLLLAAEAVELMPKTKITLETPLAKTEGFKLASDPVLLPILRSGLALLPSFITYFPFATIGFIGTVRDEKTANPKLYYKNLPPLEQHPIIILEPMIATGGTVLLVIDLLKQQNADLKKLFIVSFIGSKEGVNLLKDKFPETNLIIAQVDPSLNDKKFIIPGLGDFGDRYFGTI
ncbi:MAG: uracil phosphoribosyltransferase [Chlamydia sp. 32-24]|nr:MAG: uracil phosphoribosyltransferase [Chlamydia sp. 32-24]